ncbi:MAG: DUF465 domain-containing protein [Dissulfurispiraceae bacterium]
MKEEEIIEVLKKDNEQFRRLYQEHRTLDNQISELNKKSYLTADEEVEKKRIQKEKLHKKDMIAELIREYKKTHYSH